jgi:hypothetical protein
MEIGGNLIMKKILLALGCLLLVGCSKPTVNSVSSSVDNSPAIVNTHEHAETVVLFTPATEETVSKTIYKCECGEVLREEEGAWCPKTLIEYLVPEIFVGEAEITYEATVYCAMGSCYELTTKLDILAQAETYVPEDFKTIRGSEHFEDSTSNYYTSKYIYEDNVYLAFTTYEEVDEDTAETSVGLKVETFIN